MMEKIDSSSVSYMQAYLYYVLHIKIGISSSRVRVDKINTSQYRKSKLHMKGIITYT